MEKRNRRLVVGISGASGSVLAVELLRQMREQPGWETHLVMSRAGHVTLEHETDYTSAQLEALADHVHSNDDIGSPIASGTFRTEGMVVIPCSMKTAAGIACGYSENLLLRAADVTVKERRPLVLVARESPLSPIHLENLHRLSLLGAYILPPVLSMYTRPQSIEEVVRQIAGKALGVFGIEGAGFSRWCEV